MPERYYLADRCEFLCRTLSQRMQIPEGINFVTHFDVQAGGVWFSFAYDTPNFAKCVARFRKQCLTTTVASKSRTYVGREPNSARFIVVPIEEYQYRRGTGTEQMWQDNYNVTLL